MRAPQVPTGLLIVLLTLLAKTSGEDLYWEGEDDSANEFLEVNEYSDIGSTLSRFKRQLREGLNSLMRDTTAPSYDYNTVDADDAGPLDEDFDGENGSALPDTTEPREKTVRVSFVVMEPYRPEYSNRDSAVFKDISSSLSNAVNDLFRNLPGHHKTSLVRIQSRLSDDFSCKATLDISSIGYDNTEELTNILRNQIKNTAKLGRYTIKGEDFSAYVTEADDDNIIKPEVSPATFEPCKSWACPNLVGFVICEEERCNGQVDCPDGADELNCSRGDDDEPSTDKDTGVSGVTVSYNTTGSSPNENICDPNDFNCDETRCLPAANVCDTIPDCSDGTDEAKCPQSCGSDDFRCNDGRCIESWRRCDKLIDCLEGEDEKCDCVDDEFRCESDGICIEGRKRCDNVPHCADGSDELDCEVCPPDSFTCDRGGNVRCATRCNRLPECDAGEDEDNCPACPYRCDNKCLNESQICNNVSDCSDNSDELDCDCFSPDSFRCQDGVCIHKSLQCNGIPECADMSDEFNCTDTITPMPPCIENQYQCRDGTCINYQFLCDGQVDCTDNSDEENCSCRENEWQCTSGQCIPESGYCNGYSECLDQSDERNCELPPVITTTRATTTYIPFWPPVQTAPPVTPSGACGRNQWRCENGPCIDTNRRCDGHVDCPSDSSDEFDCPPGSPVALNLQTYPPDQSMRNGGDVVLRCRDESANRAPVRWVREGGVPIKPGYDDSKPGRLEIYKVTAADSGVYICQAPQFLGLPGSETRAYVRVEDPVPSSVITGCRPDQATCGNRECIPKSSVCDGKRDCSDGSDEESCTENGRCEPNQFQCANQKCILKTWLCDNQNDCGDGSDEENCRVAEKLPSDLCLPLEFSCFSGDQCIPKGFYCDSQPDCHDGSDESGCVPVYIKRPPSPSNVRLNPGDTLTLVCEAIGVPTPLISWRLNWGHVPKKCTATTDPDGVGTLTCPNMQPEDSGAYSCEAMNNMVTSFATPDAIVYVNKTDPCPVGYFNSEARSQSECIRCFCFGESSRCRSADLFTYNMPTPLGEGGTMLYGVKQTYNGEVEIDKESITSQYYYQPLRNGATVTLAYNSDWSRNRRVHPYLTLPETYNGNQLTSYGGHIRYRLSPHSQLYVADNAVADIIIKGKFQSLVHFHRGENARRIDIEARLTPGYWQKAGPRGLAPASREDIMMALDNIEMILLRADQNNGGVNITDFVMESAQHINVGLGVASLVEECSCPPGYEGLSCQKCASGYVRENSGPWLGNCVKRRECPPGTYTDPNNELDCRPCPCPLVNSRNQFARTCALGPAGNVICDCLPGYEGDDCSRCAPTHIGNPLVPGDSCKPKPSDNCNTLGTSNVRPLDECVCKDNVQGRYCDQCKNGSFYLSNDFRHGCALCFCTGMSQDCTSSNLRRRTTTVYFNVPSIVDQVKVFKSTPFGSGGAVRYNAPIEAPEERPQLSRGEIEINSLDRSSQPTIYYWSLPAIFGGDKITSYGGYLRYALRHIPSSGQNTRNTGADVQLVSENRLTFHYFGNFAPGNDGYLNASVQFLEEGWRRSDGKEVSREHFLLALADVKTILIKATYTTNTEIASLVSASIDTADNYGDGPLALHVEQCTCPQGHVGTSCEDCAPGYTRTLTGLYLAHCKPCECNGHSDMCNPETGVCQNCGDNTAGDNCEVCRDGYQRNEYDVCVPFSVTTPRSCNCDPRGEAAPCIDYCRCKQNVEGDLCDRCRPATFGLSVANPLGCTSCYCSGVSQSCHEASHFARIPLAAPIFGEKHGGYTLMDLRAEQVISDQFIPVPNQSELMYSFPFPPASDSEQLYWSLPVFPGNRVLSYGGTLSLKQQFVSQDGSVSSPGQDIVLVGDTTSLYWSNPNQIRSNVALSYQVPLTEANWYILNTQTPASRYDFMSVLKNLRRVLVRATLAPNLSVTSIADVSMDTATESYVSGLPVATGVEVCICPEGYSGTSCEICATGYYEDQSGYCRQCNCNGHNCQLGPSDEVICDCRPPYTGADCSSIGKEISTTNRPLPPYSTVEVRIINKNLTISQKVGSTVNFTCQAESPMTRSRLNVTWYKEDGYLPQDRIQIDQRNGVLLITNLQVSDSGVYICQSSDRIFTGQDKVTLKVPGNEMILPSVTITPPATDAYEGDTITLTCETSGNPAPTFAWQRSSNQPLPGNAATYDASLVIYDAQVEDSGEYRCIAYNSAGSTDRTAIVNVRPRPSRPLREKLKVYPQAPNVYEGQSTRVVCTGTPNIPAGTIQWIRADGSEFMSNMRDDNGVLTIESAVAENQGVYICQATSYDISPIQITITVTLRNTPSPEEGSRITVSANSTKIPTGGTGMVECIPQGYPRPLIRWTKYDGQFGPGTSQRDNTLVISNAQESDQGYYACEAIVEESTIDNIYVLVEIERREQPRVQIWPATARHIVTLGSQYDLHCRVEAGIPEPTVTWDRNGGRALSPYVQIQKHNVLRFERIDVNDEGEYTCTASNPAGTDSAKALIKVVSMPEITITPSLYIQAVIGDPVTIECRAQGYPDPEVSIRDRNNYEIVRASPRIAVLRITSVSFENEGEYSCNAKSLAGNAEERFVIQVERGDGAGTDGDGDIYTGNEEGSGEETIDQELEYPTYDASLPLIAIEGRRTVLGCNVSGDYQATWSRGDRQPLQYNAQQIGSDLIISNISKSDAGQYVCTLINRYTQEAKRAAYTRLDVVTAPSIVLKPVKQVARPGESPMVECVVYGDDVTVSWILPNREPSSRIQIRGNFLQFRQIEIEDAGEYVCYARNRVGNATAVAEVVVGGARVEAAPLVAIDQPRRAFRVREKVEILCRANSNERVAVSWERYDTNQYVDSKPYGDGGAFLIIPGVEQSDVGVYRCIGRDAYGRVTYDNFTLEIDPSSSGPSYPTIDRDQIYKASLGDTVDLPCLHNLEEPVSFEWRREYSQLPPEVRPNENNLHFERVTEEDAGTYVCRAVNSRTAVEARAVLRVTGVIPRFDGRAWVALPTMKDAYEQFDIEISFKPTDDNGLILYNSQYRDNLRQSGDFLALQLVNGVPRFTLDTGDGALVVNGDRPLQLNTWHTIRLSRTDVKVMMDVDNTGPFVEQSTTKNSLIELQEPLYVGGVPDYRQLPYQISNTSGFIGCVSMLVLGREIQNLMVNNQGQYNVQKCDTCTPNQCLNNGVCQEARVESGYVCHCVSGFAGRNCDRTGEACRPGLCGPGRCVDANEGYKCHCPISYTGKHCDVKQSIAYPAFTGSAYLAVKAPDTARFISIFMKIKPTAPVTDGIIMYCAQSPRGNGGFISLVVRDGILEFRYDFGDGSTPVVLRSNTTLRADEWTDVRVSRVGVVVTMRIALVNEYKGTLQSTKVLTFDTPLFVGGVDDSIVPNPNTGVTSGFSGCIKEVMLNSVSLDLVNSTIQSANVQECVNYDRGDIPELDGVCSQCRNGGYCLSADATACTCPPGYVGVYCESRVANRENPRFSREDPCAHRPCRNLGICKIDRSKSMNYTCDCPLGFSGLNCHVSEILGDSVGFTGNGYLELRSSLLNYDTLNLSPALVAMGFVANSDGVLLYQREARVPPNGLSDYILLLVENGVVVLEWNLGSGSSRVSVDNIRVTDGYHHMVVVKLFSDNHVELEVDREVKSKTSIGISNIMNADSNIYIGGIPHRLNYIHNYPGLTGCIHQIEFMDIGRALNLRDHAVDGRNAQRCNN